MIEYQNWKECDTYMKKDCQDNPGIYYLSIKNFKNLPSRLHREIKDNKKNLIYIGKAKSLKKRLKQELNGSGHGTFFRSIGAILNKSPDKIKNNSPNYKFSGKEKERIIKWIEDNISCKCNPVSNNKLIDEEKFRIKKEKPIFNIKNNPSKWEYLIEKRNECLKKARGE